MRLAGLQVLFIHLSSTPIAGHKAQILKVSCLPSVQTHLPERYRRRIAASPMVPLWDEMQQESGMTGYCDLFKTSEGRANAIARTGPDWQEKAGLFHWLSNYNQTLRGHAL